MRVAQDFFDRLWDSRGTEYESIEDSGLMYDLYCEGDYTNLVYVEIPSIPPDVLESWAKVEDYLAAADMYLEEITSDEFDADDSSSPSPQEYFGSNDAFEAAVLKPKITSNPAAATVKSCSVECNDRVLELLFVDDDMWVLGHGISVLVLETWTDLQKFSNIHDRPDDLD